MSRTKRIYNKPCWLEYWHPYREICMGHCCMCKDSTVSKRRRLRYKNYLTHELLHLR